MRGEAPPSLGEGGCGQWGYEGEFQDGLFTCPGILRSSSVKATVLLTLGGLPSAELRHFATRQRRLRELRRLSSLIPEGSDPAVPEVSPMFSRRALILAASFLAAGCGSGDLAPGPGGPTTGQLRLAVQYPEETADLEGDVAVYEIRVTNRDGSVQEIPPMRVPRARSGNQQIEVGPIALDQEPERITVQAQDGSGQDIGSFETVMDVQPGTTTVAAPIFSIRKTDGAWAAMGPRPSFDDAFQKVNVSGRICSLAVDPVDP